MLTIGTRFFGKDSAKDLPRLAKFLEAGQKLGKVFIAVNVAEDKCDTLAFCAQNYPAVDAFAVMPWQKFVASLNAIVYRAMFSLSHLSSSKPFALTEEHVWALSVDRLLLASAEFPPTQEQIAALLLHIDDNTLVAGARFSEHAFSVGEVVGNGITVPWNMFAIWNMRHIPRLGFPLIGDAPFDEKQAGVEEVATIALYQNGDPSLKAKLISVPGFYEEWNTAGWDEDRLKKHQAKIASKVSRPEAQLRWAGLPAPTILHIA